MGNKTSKLETKLLKLEIGKFHSSVPIGTRGRFVSVVLKNWCNKTTKIGMKGIKGTKK